MIIPFPRLHLKKNVGLRLVNLFSNNVLKWILLSLQDLSYSVTTLLNIFLLIFQGVPHKHHSRQFFATQSVKMLFKKPALFRALQPKLLNFVQKCFFVTQTINYDRNQVLVSRTETKAQFGYHLSVSEVKLFFAETILSIFFETFLNFFHVFPLNGGIQILKS